MTDTKALFAQVWDEAVEEQKQRSPSFDLSEYTVTGRASAHYGGKRNVEWWADNGHTMLDNWIAWRAETGWTLWEYDEGKPAVEMGLRFTLPGDIGIHAYIDCVFVLPSGVMAVVDVKTGRLPETPEQLGLYATGLEALGYPRPQWGYYWDAQKATHGQPLALDRFTPEFYGQMFAEAAAGINAGAFLPKAANNCKNWCGVADYCYTVGGSKALGTDPLAPKT